MTSARCKRRVNIDRCLPSQANFGDSVVGVTFPRLLIRFHGTRGLVTSVLRVGAHPSETVTMTLDLSSPKKKSAVRAARRQCKDRPRRRNKQPSIPSRFFELRNT